MVLGLSFFATYSSTNSFVGFSGQAYTYGAPWLLLAPTVVVFSLSAWLWIAPRLRAFTGAVDSVTLADYVGFRFESRIARSLAALIVISASFLYMIAVFKGVGSLLEIFLDIPYVAAIGFVFVVVMLYTAVGGFISVVKTDAVQGVVMVFAAILLFWGTVNSAGGDRSNRKYPRRGTDVRAVPMGRCDAFSSPHRHHCGRNTQVHRRSAPAFEILRASRQTRRAGRVVCVNCSVPGGLYDSHANRPIRPRCIGQWPHRL